METTDRLVLEIMTQVIDSERAPETSPLSLSRIRVLYGASGQPFVRATFTLQNISLKRDGTAPFESFLIRYAEVVRAGYFVVVRLTVWRRL